jgi:hypothetical protein
MKRRQFLGGTAAGLCSLALGCRPDDRAAPQAPADDAQPFVGPRQPYRGPNVIVIRFGGGVRRLETVTEPARTWCPFVIHDLAKKGVIFPDVEISDAPGIVTSHGQGTLYLLTGRYDRYEDVKGQAFADRFEPKVPTIFEYFRRQYDVPAHQALLVNGEDRINEEFYTFSNHHQYGVNYRSTVLSLFRFKSFLLRKELASNDLTEKEREQKTRQLHEMENKDYRVKDARVAGPELDAFWESWASYYGTSGLKNPRGDRLLTALALRAIERLRPRLMMINYQDPDYVHWGNPNFYTRAISIIDEGIREIHAAVQADAEYRDRTVFVIVPDCGRDSNRLMPVPFQHHFNTRSAREIFAVLSGPQKWIPHGKTPQMKPQQQISVAATIGEIMGFATPHAEPQSLFKHL